MQHRTCNHARHGFTLVEMSVVLAIIGLLIGGVLAGQGLLRNSELQSIITEATKYKSAYLQFKTTYNGLPGDIADAQDYWGTDPDGCPNVANNVKTTTCNGDGNGLIGYLSNGSATNTTVAPEMTRSFQQLADAGLISGSFTGSGVTTASTLSHARNVPDSRYSGGMWSMASFGANSMYGSGGQAFTAIYGSVLLLGAFGSTYDTPVTLLTPSQQWTIDTKVDDGKPSSGTLLSWKSANSGCATFSPDIYALSNNSKVCSVIYIMDPY